MYWFETLPSGEKNPAANTKFGFVFVIVMPVFLISCGKRPVAVATVDLLLEERDVDSADERERAAEVEQVLHLFSFGK